MKHAEKVTTSKYDQPNIGVQNPLDFLQLRAIYKALGTIPM